MDNNTCIVCGGNNFNDLFAATDYTVSRESFSIKKCSSCGFLFTGNPPLPDAAASYYESENYEPHKRGSYNAVTILYRAVRRLMLRYKLKVAEKAIGKRVGKLLDYGAGTGEFVGLAKSYGWDSTGIEISESARQQAKIRGGIILSDQDRLNDFEKGTYDCITYWHVLEHIYSPGEQIKKISDLLTPSGYLIIALPNAGSFDFRYYKSFWAALDVPRHLWHFSPETFLLFINKCGFEVTETKSLFFDPFYISILSEKYKESRLPMIAGLFYGLIFAVRTIFLKRGSSSLIYVCRRIKKA